MGSMLDFSIRLLKKNRKGITISEFQDALSEAKLLALGQDGEYVAKLLVDLGAVQYDERSRTIKLASKIDLERVSRVVKEVNQHLVFAKNLIEVTILLSKHFKLEKKKLWTWMNTRDPRCDDGKRTPLEVLWQDGEKGIQKIKDFISSFRAGDFA